MQHIIRVLLLSVVSISTFAQGSSKKYIQIEKRIEIEELRYSFYKTVNNTYSDLISCYYNDTLFFLRADFSMPETLRIFAFAIKTNTYSYQDFDASMLINYHDNVAYRIDNFAINEDYLVIPGFKKEVNSDFLCVFKRRGGDFIYGFDVQDSNNLFSKQIQFLPNGKLLGLKNYVYYGEKAEESSSLSILNLENKKIEKNICLEFLLPLYTLQMPYNILTVNNKSILFSQKGDYKISEYDFDLNLIGRIENKEIEWARMPQSISDSIYDNTEYAVERIHFLFQNRDKYSCVHNIYSNDNLLFVFYSNKGSFNKIYYDIWTKDNDENWFILKKGISDNTKSIRHGHKQSLSLSSMGDDLYLIDNNRFLRFGILLPELGNYPMIVLRKKFEKHILNNELPYLVEIIKFNGL